MKKLLNYIKNSKKYEIEEIIRLERNLKEILESNERLTIRQCEYYAQQERNIEESKRLIKFYEDMVNYIEEFASENDLEY